MTELPPQLRQVRDFFFKQALSLPPGQSFLHQPGFIRNQTIFRLEDLRRHLNDPFFSLDYLELYQQGRPVDLAAARCFKGVQRRKIGFVDRRVLEEHFNNGAACVLEGLDILEPGINLFMASLDRAHACTFSNAVVFFSQRGNEAYRGHADTDDVLVIHLAGSKKWRLHQRLPPRRVVKFDLSEQEMGPLEAELVLQPGDVLFLRSGTPHRVQTVGDYSMHMSFDLCDRTVNAETALDLLLKRYDRDPLRPHSGTGEVLDRMTAISRSEDFQRELAALQQQHKANYEEFRRFVGANRVSFFDRLGT